MKLGGSRFFQRSVLLAMAGILLGVDGVYGQGWRILAG